MTAVSRRVPAALGGEPAFPGGLPLTRVEIPDRAGVLARLDAILEGGQLTNGRTVRELEEVTAARLGVRDVVAVASCTAGLMLVLQALCGRSRASAGSRVLMPSFTFSATAHAAAWVGAEPAFCDVEADRLTADPGDIRSRLDGVAVLMATHIYGNPCRTDELETLAARRGIPVLYDAAHALGSLRQGRPIGGFGRAEVFSLSPTKVAVAGEGGLVATDDTSLAETLRLGRNYGNPGNYDCPFPGLNARMSELHAAVALASLASLDDRIAHRNRLAETFLAAIDGACGVRVVTPAAGDVSTYKDLTLVVDPAACGITAPGLAKALAAEGVDTRRYFWPPVHRQTAYARVGTVRLPVTDRLAPAVLTLPLWSHMDFGTVRRLGELVGDLLQHGADLSRAVDPA